MVHALYLYEHESSRASAIIMMSLTVVTYAYGAWTYLSG